MLAVLGSSPGDHVRTARHSARPRTTIGHGPRCRRVLLRVPHRSWSPVRPAGLVRHFTGQVADTSFLINAAVLANRPAGWRSLGLRSHGGPIAHVLQSGHSTFAMSPCRSSNLIATTRSDSQREQRGDIAFQDTNSSASRPNSGRHYVHERTCDTLRLSHRPRPCHGPARPAEWRCSTRNRCRVRIACTGAQSAACR
jgi:hypothetical protein